MAAKVPMELLSKLPVREAMAAVLFAAKGRPGNFGRIVAFKKPGNPDGLPGFLNALGAKIVSPKPMFSCVNAPLTHILSNIKRALPAGRARLMQWVPGHKIPMPPGHTTRLHGIHKSICQPGAVSSARPATQF